MTLKDDLLNQLQETAPPEPRGWFRWLHNHYLGRYGITEPRFEEALASQRWQELQKNWSDFSEKDRAALIPLIGRDAWTVGYLGFKEIAESCWAHLTAHERGALFAGITESRTGGESFEWIRSRLPDGVAFLPESACQIACNAIRYEWPEVLLLILNSGADLSVTIGRGDDQIYPKTHWPDMLPKLSHRVIDMILEAALIRNASDAIRLALERGADPNIPVWRLERSFNEKHCALSFAISEDRKETAELLLKAGASARGTDFSPSDYPLFLTIRRGWDDLADILIKRGASLRKPDETRPTSQSLEGSESQVFLPGTRGQFYGHFDKELNWARQAVGSLIPLVAITEKPAFYLGNGQGGYHTTILDLVIGDLQRLKRYEAMGLDIRLTPEELCTAIDADAFHGLLYLLEKHGVEVRDRVLFRIRHRNPDFGAVCREIETLPQTDGINIATDFNPGDQPPLVLANGERLFVDLDAIASPGHAHGPCLMGHFWLQIGTATYRRRTNLVVVTEMRRRWAMTKLPQNRHQLDDLLPCVKETNGQFLRLGVTLGQLFYRVRDSDTKHRIHQWLQGIDFQPVLDEAEGRIRDQDATNLRPKTPILSEEELSGYPPVFWPYLVRLETGFIGMTPERSADNPGVLDLYEVWARQNKKEDVFLPDPRLLSWEGWKEVPSEYKPFFVIDPVFNRPGVRCHPENDYEKAMIHKAVMWWNKWITPQILGVIEKHESRGQKSND